MIVYTPLCGHLRIFETGNYEHRDQYAGIVTVQWMSMDGVYLSGFKGKYNRKIYESIYRKLHSMGVRRVWYERRGKLIYKSHLNKIRT